MYEMAWRAYSRMTQIESIHSIRYRLYVIRHRSETLRISGKGTMGPSSPELMAVFFVVWGANLNKRKRKKGEEKREEKRRKRKEKEKEKRKS
jgi:hypothetical protein